MIFFKKIVQGIKKEAKSLEMAPLAILFTLMVLVTIPKKITYDCVVYLYRQLKGGKRLGLKKNLTLETVSPNP